jgi:rhodanese-related sulfurtransferase
MNKTKLIKPEAIYKQLKSKKAILLVDVREPAEHKAETIAKAHNIPLSRISLNTLTHANKAKMVVIYCHSGKRSQMAYDQLISADIPFDLLVLDGGIEAWKEAGLPVTSSGKTILPLDRQVQLTIGLMILLGMTLGYSISPLWYLLPTLAGLGLVNAGLTGWCGLARLMAMMPWNQG